MKDRDPSRRRTVNISIVVLAALGLGALSGWAGHAIVDTEIPSNTEPSDQIFVAEVGEVSRVVDVNVTARWDRSTASHLRCPGTLTSVEPGSDEISVGESFLSVDLRPVFVAVGDTPMFRDIGPGSEGDDVAQLQQMLSELGLRSNDDPPTGVFDTATSEQVRRWQRDNGQQATGHAGPCDIVFVPSLPARLMIDGATIGVSLPDEVPVVALAPDPTFEIRTTPDQASIAQPGLRVEITTTDTSWTAEISGVTTTDGESIIALHPSEGESICGSTCSTLPIDEEKLLRSRLHVVPVAKGVVVPTAALVSSPAGTVGVRLADGEFAPVTQVATSGGVTVIEGIEAGTRVRIPPGGD